MTIDTNLKLLHHKIYRAQSLLELAGIAMYPFRLHDGLCWIFIGRRTIPRLRDPPLAIEAWLEALVGRKRAMDSDRCEDTTSILNYGLDGKPLRMMSSPNSGPRHTIDNILGLVRRDGELIERSQTPGNIESAGKICYLISETSLPLCQPTSSVLNNLIKI